MADTVTESEKTVEPRISILTRHLLALLDGKKLDPKVIAKYQEAIKVNEFRSSLRK